MAAKTKMAAENDVVVVFFHFFFTVFFTIQMDKNPTLKYGVYNV